MSARGSTMLVTETLIVEECCTCGILFGMPESFQEECRKKPGISNGKGFYCPNGHQQWYTGKTEAQKEREKRIAAEQLAERERTRRLAAQDQAAAAERRASAAKGQLTKERKRATASVCPVPECKRSFVQMRRHLETKHQGYQIPAGT